MFYFYISRMRSEEHWYAACIKQVLTGNHTAYFLKACSPKKVYHLQAAPLTKTWIYWNVYSFYRVLENLISSKKFLNLHLILNLIYVILIQILMSMESNDYQRLLIVQ